LKYFLIRDRIVFVGLYAAVMEWQTWWTQNRIRVIINLNLYIDSKLCVLVIS